MPSSRIEATQTCTKAKQKAARQQQQHTATRTCIRHKWTHHKSQEKDGPTAEQSTSYKHKQMHMHYPLAA